MWWIVPALGMAVVAAFLVQFGLLPPPYATTLVWIRGKDLRVSRGRLRAQTREFLSDILREAEVTSGFIAMTPGKGVAFSRKIPSGVHQRIRNVLLNV